MRLAIPPRNTVDFGNSTAHLSVDLLTELALGSGRNRLHDELHAARLTDSVLLGAVLAKVAPLPIATGKTMLVEEAHVSGYKSWDVYVRLYVSLIDRLFG